MTKGQMIQARKQVFDSTLTDEQLLRRKLDQKLIHSANIKRPDK